MEGMISGFDDVQLSQAPQPGANWPQQVKVGQFVARTLQKEHGNFDSDQMITTGCPGLSRRVQWKTEKHQAPYTRKTILSCCH
jgi:hypothetical protein